MEQVLCPHNSNQTTAASELPRSRRRGAGSSDVLQGAVGSLRAGPVARGGHAAVPTPHVRGSRSAAAPWSSKKRLNPKPSLAPAASLNRAHGRRRSRRPPAAPPLSFFVLPPQPPSVPHALLRPSPAQRRCHLPCAAAAPPGHHAPGRRDRGAAVRPGRAERDLRGGAGDGGRGEGFPRRPQPRPRGVPHGHAFLRALHAHAPLLRGCYAEARRGGPHHRECARVLFRRQGGDTRR
jgi:hypothetical protein